MFNVAEQEWRVVHLSIFCGNVLAFHSELGDKLLNKFYENPRTVISHDIEKLGPD